MAEGKKEVDSTLGFPVSESMEEEVPPAGTAWRSPLSLLLQL